jgi:hypothetical protein
MSLSISPQMKIVAIIGLVAALALGGGMMMLGRSDGSSSAANAVPTVPLKHFHPKPGTPAARVAKKAAPAAKGVTAAPVASAAAKSPAKAAPASAAPAAAAAPAAPASTVAARPAVKPAMPTPKPKPAPKPPVAANGLPTPLDELLHTHRIVVVAIYDPEVPSERDIALPEARAGALDANAGFLAVNVLDQRVAGPLTAIAGNGTILPDPGILVYRQPGTLINTLQGFVDRDSVAEAVANALAAAAPAAPAPAAAATTTPSIAPPAP